MNVEQNLCMKLNFVGQSVYKIFLSGKASHQMLRLRFKISNISFELQTVQTGIAREF